MKEVTKEEFKKIFLKYGKASDGYGEESWNKFYRNNTEENMIFKVSLPNNIKKNRMIIVTDYQNKEYRLFFVDIDQEEYFFQ